MTAAIPVNSKSRRSAPAKTSIRTIGAELVLITGGAAFAGAAGTALPHR
jgi:hypothetical protein